MLKLLFLCTLNRVRSPTAEQVFAARNDVETDSAGLHSSAAVVLSSEQVAWADIIFVMERKHRTELSKHYRKYLKDKRVVCLDIPDEFALMDPALVSLLETKVGPYLR